VCVWRGGGGAGGIAQGLSRLIACLQRASVALTCSSIRLTAPPLWPAVWLTKLGRVGGFKGVEGEAGGWKLGGHPGPGGRTGGVDRAAWFAGEGAGDSSEALEAGCSVWGGRQLEGGTEAPSALPSKSGRASRTYPAQTPT
jgi:hypothetical protein